MYVLLFCSVKMYSKCFMVVMWLLLLFVFFIWRLQARKVCWRPFICHSSSFQSLWFVSFLFQIPFYSKSLICSCCRYCQHSMQCRVYVMVYVCPIDRHLLLATACAQAADIDSCRRRVPASCKCPSVSVGSVMLRARVQGSTQTCLFFLILTPCLLCLRCFDAVGWAAGRASGL